MLFDSWIIHSSSTIEPKAQVKRFWLHVPMGLLIVLAAWLGWQYGLILAGYFLFYEHDEAGYVRDQAWIDVKGAMAGIGAGIVALAVLKGVLT